MLAQVMSCAVVGLEGAVVQVEVDIAQGLPAFFIVGLPDTAVQESRERVRAAIKNSGFAFPLKRLTVNLAPADLRKEGPAYDLPIAVGVLLASGQVTADLEGALFLGELSLDGSVRHSEGVLPMVATAREQGFTQVYLPAADAREASLIPGLKIIPVETLAGLVAHFQGTESIAPHEADPLTLAADEISYPVDFADVRGQEHAKRAMEVAAAGGHNVIMTGPPGAGKTLLARALPSILPPMTIEEALEVTKIYSVTGLLPPETPLILHRPFRSPHHTISHAGLVGGGKWPHPGEISLAHRGVLFLDELPEFGQHTLEVLRQPLEDRVVSIARAAGSLTFPANFMLVGAMNPCPCGYYGDLVRECTDSPAIVTRYQKRISGPLLDRIDIHVEVPRVEFEKIAGDGNLERSEPVRKRVAESRERQMKRFAGTRLLSNADMGPAEVREYCPVDDAGRSLLRSAMNQLQMSARAFHRILKLSRTIADLAGEEKITTAHLAEALQYRPRRVG